MNSLVKNLQSTSQFYFVVVLLLLACQITTIVLSSTPPSYNFALQEQQASSTTFNSESSHISIPIHKSGGTVNTLNVYCNNSYGCDISVREFIFSSANPNTQYAQFESTIFSYRYMPGRDVVAVHRLTKVANSPLLFGFKISGNAAIYKAIISGNTLQQLRMKTTFEVNEKFLQEFQSCLLGYDHDRYYCTFTSGGGGTLGVAQFDVSGSGIELVKGIEVTTSTPCNSLRASVWHKNFNEFYVSCYSESPTLICFDSRNDASFAQKEVITATDAQYQGEGYILAIVAVPSSSRLYTISRPPSIQASSNEANWLQWDTTGTPRVIAKFPIFPSAGSYPSEDTAGYFIQFDFMLRPTWVDADETVGHPAEKSTSLGSEIIFLVSNNAGVSSSGPGAQNRPRMFAFNISREVSSPKIVGATPYQLASETADSYEWTSATSLFDSTAVLVNSKIKNTTTVSKMELFKFGPAPVVATTPQTTTTTTTTSSSSPFQMNASSNNVLTLENLGIRTLITSIVPLGNYPSQVLAFLSVAETSESSDDAIAYRMEVNNINPLNVSVKKSMQLVGAAKIQCACFVPPHFVVGASDNDQANLYSFNVSDPDEFSIVNDLPFGSGDENFVSCLTIARGEGADETHVFFTMKTSQGRIAKISVDTNTGVISYAQASTAGGVGLNSYRGLTSVMVKRATGQAHLVLVCVSFSTPTKLASYARASLGKVAEASAPDGINRHHNIFVAPLYDNATSKIASSNNQVLEAIVYTIPDESVSDSRLSKWSIRYDEIQHLESISSPFSSSSDENRVSFLYQIPINNGFHAIFNPLVFVGCVNGKIHLLNATRFSSPGKNPRLVDSAEAQFGSASSATGGKLTAFGATDPNIVLYGAGERSPTKIGALTFNFNLDGSERTETTSTTTSTTTTTSETDTSLQSTTKFNTTTGTSIDIRNLTSTSSSNDVESATTTASSTTTTATHPQQQQETQTNTSTTKTSAITPATSSSAITTSSTSKIKTKTKTITIVPSFPPPSSTTTTSTPKPSPIPGKVSEKVYEASAATANVVAGVASAAGGAPAAAMTAGRALALPQLVGCSSTNQDGEPWLHSTIAFPMSFLPSEVGFGVEIGYHVRAALASVLGVLFLVFLLAVTLGIVKRSMMAAEKTTDQNDDDDMASQNEHNSIVLFIVSRVMVFAIAQTITSIGETVGMLLGAPTDDTLDIVLSIIPLIVLFVLFAMSVFSIRKNVFFDSSSTTTTTSSSALVLYLPSTIAANPPSSSPKTQNLKELSVSDQDKRTRIKNGKLASFINSAWGRFFLIGDNCWYISDPNSHPVWTIVHKFQGPIDKLRQEEEKLSSSASAENRQKRKNKSSTRTSSQSSPTFSSSFREKLRSQWCPYALLFYATSALLVSLLSGLAKARASTLCPSLLSIIAVINSIVFLFDVIFYPVFNIPVRGWINATIDFITAIISIITATSMTTFEEAQANPGLGQLISVGSIVVVILGTVCMVTAAASSIIALRVAKARVVPKEEFLNRAKNLQKKMKMKMKLNGKKSASSSSEEVPSFSNNSLSTPLNDDEDDEDEFDFRTSSPTVQHRKFDHHHHHHHHSQHYSQHDDDEEMMNFLGGSGDSLMKKSLSSRERSSRKSSKNFSSSTSFTPPPTMKIITTASGKPYKSKDPKAASPGEVFGRQQEKDEERRRRRTSSSRTEEEKNSNKDKKMAKMKIQGPITKESSVNDIVESLQHTLLKQKQRKRKVDELLFDEDDLEDEQYLLEAVKGSSASLLKSPTMSSSKRRDHHHHHAIDIDDNVLISSSENKKKTKRHSSSGHKKSAKR